ncbi:MAG: rhodanese-like domain-containing protein [Microscillaceae bacterium]|jgi:rhodanese-related sulfurtransferase|nr:rhodanese-like domain-containing protein [Microscillaceae bacterium]
MFNMFKTLFGNSDMSEIKNLIAENQAVVIDVRTPQEFAGGHPQGAKNIPLDKLANNLNTIKNFKKVVVVCCASGMRSASAKALLQKSGIEEVYDAGSWVNLK